jgi:hypothetical protein
VVEHVDCENDVGAGGSQRQVSGTERTRPTAANLSRAVGLSYNRPHGARGGVPGFRLDR